MNVYDFDGTIYDGDSTVDFYRYCVRHYPRVRLRWPSLAAAAFLYAVKRIDKTGFKQRFYAFLRDVPDVDKAVQAFWAEKSINIKAWYKEQRKDGDLIISASPEFLLKPICEALGVSHLIASRVDKKTGLYDGVNCGGEEKVRRYREDYGDAPVEEFYSDSHADDPMAAMAQKSIWVKGNRREPWPEKK